MPKETINIYEQADDATKDLLGVAGKLDANGLMGEEKLGERNYKKEDVGNSKKEDISLNEMLGIKKHSRNSDFDDLLGNVGTVGLKVKNKNKDFFADLDL